MLSSASQSASLALYRTWACVGLSAIRPAGAVMTLILIGIGSSGCSLSRSDAAFARMDDRDLTGSLGGAQAKRVDADRERSGLRPQCRLRCADQGRQGFQPALGKPRDRRAGIGDAVGAGLQFGRRAHLPRFPGQLCQRTNRKLAAGGRLPGWTWKVGNSYSEALAVLIPAPLGRCKNATDSPNEQRVGRIAPGFQVLFPS